MASGKVYSLEAVFNLMDKASNPLGQIQAKGVLTEKAMKSTFVSAQAYADKFANHLKKVSSGLLRLTGLAAVLNFNSIKQFLMADITNALELADTMARIGHAANITGPPLEQVRQNLMKVSSEAGFTVKELAKIANTSIMSGIAAGSSADFAAVVAKTAKITGTASDQIVNGLTTVINAYGMSADEASRVSGMMINANRLGKTSFEEMSAGMKNVIPAAAALGIQTEHVFAGITALTSKGLNTKDAMKTLGDSFSAVKKPSKDAAALAKRLGIDFSEAALRSKGFAGFMEDIKQKTGGNTRILETLFGNEKIARSISILTTTGAAAFKGAINEMTNSLETVNTEFARVTDTPAERWKKAMNKISNAGTSLGIALMPLVERVIGKVTEIADRLAAIDFSQYMGTVETVFNGIEKVVSFLIGAIKIAWQFRGVILAIVGVMALYRAVQLLVVGAGKAIVFWEDIKKTRLLLTTIFTGTQTAALALLDKESESHIAISAAFSAAEKIKTFFLTIATKGMLTQKAATAAMAVASGHATAAQWLLNVAMNANPIGLVVAAIVILIGVIAALVKWGHKVSLIFIGIAGVIFGPIGAAFGFLISGIVEVVKGWDTVKKAFQEGGILAALKQIGALFLSGLIAPIQGFLELLSKIPGVGKLLGPAVNKLKEFRTNLKGPEIEPKVKEPQKSAFDKFKIPGLETPDMTMPDLNAPEVNMPEVNYPEFNMPDMNIPGMEKSKFKGVVDISGGTPALPRALPDTVTKTAMPPTDVAAITAPAPVIPDTITQGVTGINQTLQTIAASIKTITAAMPPIIAALNAPQAPPSAPPAAQSVFMPPAPQMPPVPNLVPLVEPRITIPPAVSPIPALPNTITKTAMPPKAPPVPQSIAAPAAVAAAPPPLIPDALAQCVMGIDQTLQTISASIKTITFTPVAPEAPVFETLPAPLPIMPSASQMPPPPLALARVAPPVETFTASAAIKSPLPKTVTKTSMPPQAPARAMKTPYKPPQSPQPKINTGREDREQAEREDPRQIAPITREERTVYYYKEQIQKILIEVAAEKGTAARIVKAPPDAKIKLVNSGSNA